MGIFSFLNLLQIIDKFSATVQAGSFENGPPGQTYKYIMLLYLIVVVLVGEQGMVDEAQKALEEAEALKKVAN